MQKGKTATSAGPHDIGSVPKKMPYRTRLLVIAKLTNNFGFWSLLLTIICPSCWGQSDAKKVWMQQIHLHLKSHAKSPPEACVQNGDPKLAFALDRSGKVVSSRLLKGSGVTAIDAAALDAVTNAQPFPPAPPEVAESEMSFSVVLSFGKPADFPAEDFKRHCDMLRGEISLRNRINGVCRGC